MGTRLLTRDEFRTAVFARDKNKCVICGNPAVDAHHIIDRSLWDTGGYYLDNGVSVCEDCHLKAEQTLLGCDQLREAAHITTVLIPDHFYADEKYDHWGNILLPNGTRLKGELFGNENVKRVLPSGILSTFQDRVKYPRTYHFPWSPNLQNDDRMHDNVDFFLGKRCVATVKLDGENTTMYPDYIHARSLDSKHHPSRDWVKALHGRIKYEIPEGWRICGENMYATHSIHYENLLDYFYVFSIWNENNISLDWDETVGYSEMIGLQVVPELCRFEWTNNDKARDLIEKAVESYKCNTGDDVEGYVVRVIDSIPYKDFRRCAAKCVRKGHVQTDEHWMSKPVVPNELRK